MQFWLHNRMVKGRYPARPLGIALAFCTRVAVLEVARILPVPYCITLKERNVRIISWKECWSERLCNVALWRHSIYCYG
ncbi:MAG: hypothetical protein H6937_00750 [Burkholderiales bacterium]|nr:hypothetical protein [Burkholderiales bacterium]MDR4518348.1 hypothetical protein [Nitrosomonas sp.]